MIRFLSALLGLAACLAAQGPGTLKGRVTDEQGRPIHDAQVRLYRQDTQSSLLSSTNTDGQFAFERITPGAFLLEVGKESFRTTTRSVQFQTGAAPDLDITLGVEGVRQSVLVTASGTAQSVDEISKPITVVPEEEIRNRNEFSFSEILRNTPGVLITNGGGPGQNTSIRIRGLRAEATAVLIDGMRFRDSSSLQADASSMISTLNFVAADRVEVLRGSGSSLYGTNAAGGVVNVVTDQGGAPLHGQVQVEGGNMGFYRGRATMSGGAFRDRLKYTAGLLHLNVTNGVDGQDANRSTGGQGFVRYDLTPSMTLSGRLWASDDFVQLNVSPATSGIPEGNFPSTGPIPAIPLSPGNVAILNAGGTPSYAGATYIPGRNDPDSRRASRFLTSAFILRHTLTPRLSWQASYQRMHNSRVHQDGPIGGGFQPSVANWSRFVGDIDTADVRGTAQLTSWLSLTGGYEYENEGYLDRQEDNLPAPIGISTRTKLRQQGHAGYFAAQAGLLERRLQLSFSGRVQDFRLSTPEFGFLGTDNVYASVPLLSPKRALTGDLSIAYLVEQSNTKVRVHAGNAYRAPSLYERFGGGFFPDPVTGIVGFNPYGDPRLAPDRYNSIDGGVDQYLFGSRVRLSATVFYTRMVSLSAFDFSGNVRPETDPYGRFSGYINGSGGISRGFEFGLEARPLRSIVLSGAYTFTNADLDRDTSAPGFYRALGVPAHTVAITATKTWANRFDTTVDAFRNSSYFGSFFAGSGSRAFEFPAFSKVDLVTNYRFWDNERKSARIYAKIDNLFNRRYYQGGWLAPRTTFVTGLGYGF